MQSLEEKFEIHLPQFEGPFDLLLFFIERDELDIYDIPIAKITNDFLQYISAMTSLNIELASEFIFVAARLMQIKAHMLLPRPEIDEAGNEVDPRTDLIQRLIEYKKFKTASLELEGMHEERMKAFKRGNFAFDIQQIRLNATQEEELQTLDLFKLLNVYVRVLNRYQNQPEEVRHTVVQHPYTIEEQKHYITQLLSTNERLNFETLLLQSKDRVQLVYSFLAILEMLQQQLLDIQIGLGFNNFWLIQKNSNPDERITIENE